MKFPIKLRIHFEYLKNLINRATLALNGTRLSKLEAEFIISDNSSIFFIAIENYGFTKLKILHRIQSTEILSTKKLTKCKNTYSQITNSSVRLRSQTGLPFVKTIKKRIISDELTELMKNSESIKYIRLNQ